MNKSRYLQSIACGIAAVALAVSASAQSAPDSKPTPADKPSFEPKAAPEEDPSWKTKKASEWTIDDNKEVLTRSPWARVITPEMGLNNTGQGQRGASRGGSRGGGMGRGGGINIGGIGIGMPGAGRGGYPQGGGSPQGGNGGGNTGRYPPGSTSPSESQQTPKLTLRWESAKPIHLAELNGNVLDAPTVEEGFYAIAVYGVPSRMLTGTEKTLAADFKKKASLKREGKKDIAPSSVEVLLKREDGPVIVFLFPHSKEISAKDMRVEFDAQIGRLSMEEPFYLDEMVFEGKLEL